MTSSSLSLDIISHGGFFLAVLFFPITSSTSSAKLLDSVHEGSIPVGGGIQTPKISVFPLPPNGFFEH